jgi:hypothetical protein
MGHRLVVLGAPAIFLAAACVQQLDTQAASGTPDAGADPPKEVPLSTVILPGPPPFGFFDESGQLTSSNDVCDVTRAQARAILTHNCAGCHGGRTPGERAGSPPFDYVLDPNKLVMAISTTTPPMRFIAPGEPLLSRVYLRIRHGEMPPASPPQLPRPTISDMSVLEEWIAHCLGPKLPPLSIDGGAGGDAG